MGEDATSKKMDCNCQKVGWCGKFFKRQPYDQYPWQCNLECHHPCSEEFLLWYEPTQCPGGFVPSSKSWTFQAWNGHSIPQGMVPEERQKKGYWRCKMMKPKDYSHSLFDIYETVGLFGSHPHHPHPCQTLP